METAAAQHLCKIRPSRNQNSNGNYNYTIRGKIARPIHFFTLLLFSEKCFTKSSVLGISILTQLSDFVAHLFPFKGRAHCSYTRDLEINPFSHLFIPHRYYQ